MHGHGDNECFRLHPHLRKEKVPSKQPQENVVIFDDHEHVIPNYVEVEGNTLKMLANIEEPIEASSVHTEPSLVIIDVSSFAEGNNFSNTSIVVNKCENMDEQMLAITSTQNNVISIPTTLCVINKNLLDMEFIMTNNNCINIISFQSVVNDQDNMMKINAGSDISSKGNVGIGNSLEQGELVIIVKENEELGMNSKESVKDGVKFEEGLQNDSKLPSNSHYHSDAFTDTEDMAYFAKCFAKDDNDTSYIKFHNRRGRKNKNFSL
ncbi:hypothetical protein IEQ34_021810 [Dendrobium chrysotoxum]|uniref:Uncharacterized protein n=1 Tax=Dendrobium chrysotoxum TaxID=161865 RepID=A0AAV7FXE3_DENCH|nr:hypothetical protein IEQ34_021810 [Dendrobium chrysotoxum]